MLWGKFITKYSEKTSLICSRIVHTCTSRIPILATSRDFSQYSVNIPPLSYSSGLASIENVWRAMYSTIWAILHCTCFSCTFRWDTYKFLHCYMYVRSCCSINTLSYGPRLCSIENVWRATARYMGPYSHCTCFTSKHACSDETLTHCYMSGLAVGKIHYLLSTGKHHLSGAALSLVTILATWTRDLSLHRD